MNVNRIVKPFSLKEALLGAKVETRDGRSAKIICTDKLGQFPIVALIRVTNGQSEICNDYTPRGYITGDEVPSDSDLVIVEYEKSEPWADDKEMTGGGYMLLDGEVVATDIDLNINSPLNSDVFATEKHAKSARAMARISQIMANDDRFGGPITDGEWEDEYVDKFILDRVNGEIIKDVYVGPFVLLAFHTEGQRNLFLSKYERLVKDFLMID